MLRQESAGEAAFRKEVAEWLAGAVPPELRDLTFRPSHAEALGWYRKLSGRGWVAPHWPQTFGGMGASPVEQIILMEELARAGAPDFPTQGLNHIGPTLMARGNPVQQTRHLPPILAGDVIWCQGYSEPGAGSDLANLRTRAEVRGDRLIVNGHKIWTTWGHHADWMFALVRTGQESAGRDGITFVLIDLHSDGVTRRPIETIAGDDEFCEVFFDDVAVPLENVVGELGDGWSVATAVLMEERLRLGAPALAFKAMERLRRVVSHLGRNDAHTRHRLAQAEVAVETLVAAYLSAAETQGEGTDGATAYLKILSTETVQQILAFAQELAGEYAALKMPLRDGDGNRVDLSEMYLQSRRLSIYGGTNEIQRTLIASKVLELPRSARPKKGTS
ncbi:acyl-CoA dehydrogenase family protein [Paraburkholderia fungorum]|uniref:acyl-CoA dehydrogenase family protein n=1 Tax=Paraburkholderia fungorum TaxID=134537 RepID=UPI0038BB58E5